MGDNAKNIRLFNQDGSRNVAAERQIQNTNELRMKYESQVFELAQKTHMLESQQYVPATDEEAQQLHREAQRTAAGMAAEVVQTLRSLMLTSKRASVQLDAAKALFEIGGRIRGGDGKAGMLPGANVIVIDRGDLARELESRKASGKL